ncbi:PEP_CTERM-anchored TLD domain-containing protein [Neptunomonas antarctica]|uniref:PEP-CTERM protein-sorting domain-containing protein n=1 Tax=Neptunomonas antarctica TaxID=619304 RepID=A0A1N7IZS3_9GAMM|nr:PEP_CTERM-anchored TLD domain-containing protein [Neptunomonas antarctica]SIS42539.1 PEP-CTERM protein-sorting domain-containing protein [Neptunomonas antarctica]
MKYIKQIIFQPLALCGLCLAIATPVVHAGIIDPTSHNLSNSSATWLEGRLGQGDLDWDSIWYGTTGASSTSWHAAVDGVGPTVSIYDVNYAGQNYLIGGYTDLDWTSGGYKHDSTDGFFDSFIFNLNTQTTHKSMPGNWGTGVYAIYAVSTHFATFGGGHDIFGGSYTLGGNAYSNWQGTYNLGLGNIIDNANNVASFTVNSLETFAFAPAASVPTPGTIALFSLGLMGLGLNRRRQRKAA